MQYSRSTVTILVPDEPSFGNYQCCQGRTQKCGDLRCKRNLQESSMPLLQGDFEMRDLFDIPKA